MIDPKETVRIKYIHDDEIKNRVSGSVIPRKNEVVQLYDEDETGCPVGEESLVVKEIVWNIATTAERKPDVVNVFLETRQERKERLEEYIPSGVKR